MSVNKVTYNNNTLIDVSSDTVTSQSLLQGYTAIDNTGTLISGAYNPLKAQIIVVTEDGNNVSIFEGTTKVADGTSDGGACLFEIPHYGQYQIVVSNSSLGEIAKAVEVSITEVKQYVVKINIIGTLEETSWDVIKAVSQSGKAQNYWEIGDTKSYTSEGTTHYFEIAKFGSDYITFDLKDVFQTNAIYYGYTTGGLIGSFGTIYYNYLPSDVKAVTSSVSMPTYSSVFGTSAYPIFATAEGRKKGMDWWLSDYYGVTTSTPRPDQILYKYVTSAGGTGNAPQTSYKGINYYFNV